MSDDKKKRSSRLRKYLRKLRRPRTCTDCGLLAYGEQEADYADRMLLHAGHSSAASPRGPVDRWNCAKGLWRWPLVYFELNWDVLFDEVTADQRGCPGFRKWRHGRSPVQHLESEDFWPQLILKVAPTVTAKVLTLLLGGVTLVGSVFACCYAD